jgi:hypothetical protein
MGDGVLRKLSQSTVGGAERQWQPPRQKGAMRAQKGPACWAGGGGRRGMTLTTMPQDCWGTGKAKEHTPLTSNAPTLKP